MKDTLKDIWGYLTETEKGRDILVWIIIFLAALFIGLAI